jgi:phage tail-like protein
VTCAVDTGTFRLLDAYVGWDATARDGLVGLDDPDGIMLALLDGSTGILERDLLRAFGSPRLARGCGPCEWYLVTPGGRLLYRDACTQFRPVWRDPHAYPLADPVAVAAIRRDVAVADAHRVLWWSGGGTALSTDVDVDRPGPIAFTQNGHLLVALSRAPVVRRYGPTGVLIDAMRVGKRRARITHLACAADCSVWAAVVRPDGSRAVSRAPRPGWPFRAATAAALATAFPDSAVVAAGDDGFCLELGQETCCYDWEGRPSDAVAPPTAPARVPRGQLLTTAIDSGIPRCRWHRVRLDADVPPGTSAAVAVATSEEPAPAPQGDPTVDPDWSGFPSGVPYPSDWQTTPLGAVDALLDRPPGRYLFLRLRLTGRGPATPTIRRITLDFPRATSLDLLPAVYRQTPEAEDFSERFLSLFDASVADLDRVIERHPALLDVDGVPDAVLPWLGTFFDLVAEPWWGRDRYRRVLHAAPELYRRRGTVAGLVEAIRLVHDVEPAIREHAPERAWGAVGTTARLGGVRLFGRSRNRFRVGRSPLSRAPLNSLGNPDLDPLTASAYRFSVLVPAGAATPTGRLDSLRRLVAAQAPAHTVPIVRVGGCGFVVGTWSAVGVDTAFTPLGPPVLGGSSGTVRLSSLTVLWPGRHHARGFAADAAVVGLSTVTR